MQIGIIGSGNIGSTLARLAVAAGIDVVIANRRGPASLGEFVVGLGSRARAVTVEEIGRGSAIVVEAIPFGQLSALPAGAIDGQVVVTAANYYPGRDGPLELPRTQSEYAAQLFPGARVVKAFNTIKSTDLRDQGDPARPEEERRAIVMAGDDVAAKELVAGFVRAIGFGPLDLGLLAAGRFMEPGGPFFLTDLTVAAARGRLAALAGTGPRPD